MTKTEMMMEMFRLQLEEDRKVHEEFGISYKQLLDENKYFYALLDELGELNHELKPDWCWWKKNAGEVDRAKVLEEFSDVTHFVLSYRLACCNGDIEKAMDTIKVEEDTISNVTRFIDNPVQWLMIDLLEFVSEHERERLWDYLLGYWINLCRELDLDFETEVYEPYVRKNRINQKRVEDGY